MIKCFAKVDSVFTENGVDCLWMVTKHHVKNRVIILVIVNINCIGLIKNRIYIY